MSEVDAAIYRILLWALPILLAVLGFIGALVVKQLMNLSSSVNDIKVTLERISTQHEDLERRVHKVEKKIYV